MNIENLAYALLSGTLPALIWLWFWLKEDNLHPEPRSLIAITFLSGGLAVIIAILLEKRVADMVADSNLRYILWAAVEEIVKFGIVVLVAFRARYIDEPIDAMIYCITMALGFAAIENTFFILSPLGDGEIAKSIVTGNMRFIGATLVHVVSSASIGFMIALSFYKNAFIKSLSIAFGIILSIALHAAFNLTIINLTATNTLKVFGWVWCSVVILIILFEEAKGIKPKTASR
ncbi:MAG: PrsW family glutamic-type intramembrane protease [Patescibacteria group bacterium]